MRANASPDPARRSVVGRTAELTVALGCFDAGGPGTCLITGSAGVGKTHLLDAVAHHYRDGSRTSEHACGVAAGGTTPLAPFLHLLLGDPAPAQKPAEQLVRVMSELHRRAAGGPLLLTIDDAHLLDDSSLLLVRHLAAGGRIHLLLAARADAPLHDDLLTLVKDGDCATISLHDVVRHGQAQLVATDLAEGAARSDATWLEQTCAAHATAAAERDGDALLAVSARFEAGGLDLYACEAASQAAHAYERAGNRFGTSRACVRVDLLLAVCGSVGTPAVGPVTSMVSAREYQVAKLAVSGLTNAEIGERLGTSPRTVGNQLQRLYEKLQIHSRDDLASLFAPRNGCETAERGGRPGSPLWVPKRPPNVDESSPTHDAAAGRAQDADRDACRRKVSRHPAMRSEARWAWSQLEEITREDRLGDAARGLHPVGRSRGRRSPVAGVSATRPGGGGRLAHAFVAPTHPAHRAAHRLCSGHLLVEHGGGHPQPGEPRTKPRSAGSRSRVRRPGSSRSSALSLDDQLHADRARPTCSASAIVHATRSGAEST